jgi:hypothetical protein
MIPAQDKTPLPSNQDIHDNDAISRSLNVQRSNNVASNEILQNEISHESSIVPNANTHNIIFACRRCRQLLFKPESLIEHEVSSHSFEYHRMMKSRNNGENIVDPSKTHTACTSYFLQEPLKWMEKTSADVEGKLLCPKCSNRVGVLKWAGNQCSCGSWVTPAIQIYKKSVDERFLDRKNP